MNVVVDTNIVVSAAIRGGIPQKCIRLIASSKDVVWVASREVYEEYRSVLARPKFRLTQSKIYEWLSLFDELVEVHECRVAADFPRDPKDAKFLACAIATGAAYLISGDRDFQSVAVSHGFNIITPADFVALMEGADRP